MKEMLAAQWETLRGVVVAHGIRILIILVACVVIYRLILLIVGRIRKAVEDDDPDSQSEVEKRAETLGRIIQQVSSVLLAAVAGMLIMNELGFEIGPLIAGAGIAGLAVGFGAPNLVRDVITGFFILLENQIRVGDVVEIAGKSGLVEEMNLRTTVLRDLEGSVHVIPNGSVDTVTNRTREWSRALLDVGVAYKENVDEVMQVLEEIGKTIEEDSEYRRHILEPLTILGVNDFADSAVMIRIMFKTRPLKQWEIGRELRRRIKNRFDELGIEIPFPHVTLYAGEGAQGVFRTRAEAPAENGPEVHAAD